jgi:hypothetical protein
MQILSLRMPDRDRDTLFNLYNNGKKDQAQEMIERWQMGQGASDPQCVLPARNVWVWVCMCGQAVLARVRVCVRVCVCVWLSCPCPTATPSMAPSHA